jgi:hypothetical protein
MTFCGADAAPPAPGPPAGIRIGRRDHETRSCHAGTRLVTTFYTYPEATPRRPSKREHLEPVVAAGPDASQAGFEHRAEARAQCPDLACLSVLVLFICVFMPRWTRCDVPTGVPDPSHALIKYL